MPNKTTCFLFSLFSHFQTLTPSLQSQLVIELISQTLPFQSVCLCSRVQTTGGYHIEIPCETRRGPFRHKKDIFEKGSLCYHRSSHFVRRGRALGKYWNGSKSCMQAQNHTSNYHRTNLFQILTDRRSYNCICVWPTRTRVQKPKYLPPKSFWEKV